jgi:hypothetical protein
VGSALIDRARATIAHALAPRADRSAGVRSLGGSRVA